MDGSNEVTIIRDRVIRKMLRKIRVKRRSLVLLFFCLLISSVGLMFQKSLKSPPPRWKNSLYIHEICSVRALDGRKVCRPDCTGLRQHFSLPGMSSCHPWLTCSDEIITKRVISSGMVKLVLKAKWQNFTVAKNVLKNPKYRQLFQENTKRLKELNPSLHVTQIIGICNDTLLTEFFPYGTADNFKKVLMSLKPKFKSARQRLLMCINYVEVIHFLHNSPVGVLMLCDSNSVMKSLKQFLLAEDLSLVLNDVDSIPNVDSKNGTVCNKDGHIKGTLLAPEQKWPFKNITKYDWELMPPYNEKVDIWRVPDICQELLGKNGTDHIEAFLSKVHDECKSESPSARPTTSQILNKYYQALDVLGL